MESLKSKSNQLVSSTSTDFSRYLMNSIDWKWRLTGILGARGTGKTTLLLQHLKTNYGLSDVAMYISLDDLYFAENKLTDTAQEFMSKGGQYLYIDEVHKYKNWAIELKNLYDYYPALTIYFTGSSVIEILKQDVDLSRRAITYHINGLSFREFLILNDTIKIPPLTIDEILINHSQISSDLVQKFKPLAHFYNYLKFGYYPFYFENKEMYYRRLEQIIKLIIENDINFIEGYDPRNAFKMKQLLYVLAENVPFKPNIIKLSEKIGIHRNTLVNYLYYLEKAQVIQLLHQSGVSIGILQKPEKIYLNNTNLSYLISQSIPDKGTIRETFFMNQIGSLLPIKAAKTGDFEVDNKWIFEIGGKNKTRKQLIDSPNSFTVVDDIETGAYQKIPLWLFGLLY
ncbi:MAG: ATP-binding protein [Tenuifilaceae bacterium]